MSRALLIGTAPAAALGYTYVAEAPFEAVVIGSLTLGQLLCFRQEQVLAALAEGKPVVLYTPGLPEASRNRELSATLASRRRELKSWGIVFTDGGQKRLITAQEAEVHGFEDKRVFEGCMPVEVMARRGHETLRFGPLKPVGLVDPATGKEPYAVVQLRQDNAVKTVFNLVGFQTHLKFPEQKRVFSMIPALKNAEFVRYGVMHQNTFLQSPKLLDRFYADRRNPLVAFAGQMTGVEGYVESAASGFLAAVAMAAKVRGEEPVAFPRETAIGALGLYISDERLDNFQPMNVNFSIVAPLEQRIRKKAEKNLAIANRSLAIIDELKTKV